MSSFTEATKCCLEGDQNFLHTFEQAFTQLTATQAKTME